MTVGLVGVGVDLARRRGPGRVLLVRAAASRARGSRRRRGRRTRAGRPARRGARGRAAHSSVPSASVPSSHARVELDGELGRLAGALEAALLGRRQDVRRRRRRARRRRPAARRPSRSRSAASAGPAGRSPGSWPPRGRSRPPRAGRRSRRAARAAGRGRGRTAGTGRRRRCRGRTSGAPRCAARRRRRSRGGRCGVSRSRSKAASGERPAGSSASTAARCAAVGGELGEDRLAAAVAEQVVVLVEADAGARRPGCRGRAAGSGPRRGRRSWSSSGPGSGRGRGPRKRRERERLIGHGTSSGTRSLRRRRWSRSAESCRLGVGRCGQAVGSRRRRRVRRRRARPGRVSASAARVAVDRRLDVGGGHAVVGHGADLAVGIFHHHDAARSERGEERRPVALDLEQDEVRADPRRGRAGRGVGWAVPPAATTPSISDSASARRRALAWSSARRSIMPSGPSRQGDQPGRGEDAGLAHPATDHLAGAARAPDEVARTDDDRADRAGERPSTGRT